MFLDLLRDTHLSRPSELSTLLNERSHAIGVEQMVLYLIDYEQDHLMPLPGPGTQERAVLRVQGTVGGRAFASLRVQDVDAGLAGRRRLWIPLLDGTERLGVIEMIVPTAEACVDAFMVEICERYAHLSAQLVMGKGQYGDAFELARRRQPMSIAAEMQWQLIPPLVFATAGLVVAGMLEPAYRAGGDSFDYAVNDHLAHLAVFDAMGHGVPAATAATVAVGAYRNSRRRGLDLEGTYAAVDEVMLDEFGGERFATGVLARLNLDTGALSWTNAGHPAPLLIRHGQLVKTLTAPPSTPLGVPLGDGPPQVANEPLEPGDRVLFYTDGLIEARTADGSFFTAERLADFLARQDAAGLPAPETLRRLRRAIMDHQDGQLQDDASALLVEWHAGSEQQLLPRPAAREP